MNRQFHKINLVIVTHILHAVHAQQNITKQEIKNKNKMAKATEQRSNSRKYPLRRFSKCIIFNMNIEVVCDLF